MISRPLTRVVNSTEMMVATGQTITAEGQALVRKAPVTADGVGPSSGTAAELFVGFAFAGTSAYPFDEILGNKVETFVVGTGGQVTLARTPVGDVAVFDQDAAKGSQFSKATPTGNVVSGLTVGDTVTITYRFNMTVAERVALVGNTQPGGYAGAYVNQIGVITRGFIMTSEYDPTVDWTTAGSSASTAIVCGADGVITLGANDGSAGAVVPGSIVRLPDESYPYLGVEFSANA